ncbi:MAG TPA: lysylphosphatidylglycerol synthase transmembrane domain-containing protein [Tepidisphaeraceae bacterium]|jgi:uncharacterized protein (TIRG00374 family)|nr:lysylphosphatidylglycerol synthase transmembrane domain-containing protein [Tepidisphaeraceae bacterium]
MTTDHRKSRAKKWLTFLLRWGIAVAGIWYVLSNISWSDRVIIQSKVDGWPVACKLASPADDNADRFQIIDESGAMRWVDRNEVVAKADPVRIKVRENGAVATYDVLAQKPIDDPNVERNHWPFLVSPPRNLWQRYWGQHVDHVRVVNYDDILEPRPGGLPYPLIDRGVGEMVKHADRKLLLCAIAIFPITFLITSIRWHMLLRALGIRITMYRAFVINMVGAFYNTFLPGSTGGDVVKAVYAAKQTTTHRTRAVMSVIIDRVLGLLALIVLGGTMAGYQYFKLPPTDPASHRCAQIAVGSLAIILGTCIGLLVYYQPLLRKCTGLDFVLRKLPMQKHIAKIMEVMEIYRQRPLLIVWAITITLPVHGTVVVAAMLSGMAFDLPIPGSYYWVVVPVIVLAGSIPISPQGAGVMEFFAIILTRRYGCTVSQAFALTMSIRIVQILWNLVGGIFVLRGGFHVPTEKEQEALEADTVEEEAIS